jgi:cell wall-associated NlpC family hydrolase
MSQVGKQYIFGAEANPNDPNPRDFDCSELVE